MRCCGLGFASTPRTTRGNGSDPSLTVTADVSNQVWAVELRFDSTLDICPGLPTAGPLRCDVYISIKDPYLP